MNIEEMNARITSGHGVRIDRNETIRGGINLELLDRLREYWRVHGCPTDEDIKKMTRHIRICK
jgi:pyruvate carboxylase